MNILSVIGYPLFFIAASEAALGALLLRKKLRGNPVNKSAAALSFFSAFWSLFAGMVYIFASAGLDYNLFYRACWIGWLGIPAAFQLVYYLKGGGERTARRAGAFLYPFWVLVFILCFITNLMETGAYSLVPFAKPTGLLENPTRLFGALLLAWIVYELFELRRKSSGLKRAQLNYFLLGSISFAFGAALLSGVFQLFGRLRFDPALGSYASLPWAALTYYSISRYRLFDIRIASSRTLTAALLLLGGVALHLALFKVLEPAAGPTPAILLSLAAVALIIFKTPLRKTVSDAVGDIVLRGKYGYQEVLRVSIRAITTISDLKELADYVVKVIKNSMGVENICLFMKGEDSRYGALSCCGAFKNTASRHVLGDAVITWLQQTRQVFIREEQELLKSWKDIAVIHNEIGTIGAELIIPLFHKGDLLGVLALGYKGNREIYVQSDVDLLESLAAQAAVAVKNIRLTEEAITDGLTGLYVHKYFKQRLQEEVERSKRYIHPVSLLLIDFDFFKRVNDQYGHLAGDRVLREIARLWKENIRLGDFLARYGGEEFAIILPETSLSDAERMAENLRALTENRDISGIRITISTGIGYFDGKGRDFDYSALIRQADNALYRAKRKGRNLVESVA